MKKKFTFLVLCFCSFFFSINSVDAAHFLIDLTSSCTKDSTCSPIPGNDTNIKYVALADGSKGSLAYCSDHDRLFYGKTASGGIQRGDGKSGDVPYRVDNVFATSKQCWIEGNTNLRLDCSEMVGYIIHNSYLYYGGYNEQKKWYWTQVTVWAYLARFSYLRDSNTAGAHFYGNYRVIRDVINQAYNEYKKIYSTSVENSDVNSVNFSVDTSDNPIFYYFPGLSGCASGYYKTKNITIKNNEDVAIEIDISAMVDNDGKNDDVLVCDATSCEGAKEDIILRAGKTKTIYLMSKNNHQFDKVTLSVDASYKKTIQGVSYVSYDSTRWIPAISVPNYQGMLTLIKSKKNPTDTTVVENHYQTITKNFKKDIITRKSCKKSNTTLVKKVCANEAQMASDYKASFSNCSCLGLKLSGGRYVNINLVEKVYFNYGELEPYDKIYAGGGFGLSLAIKTMYKAEISWSFADTKNGKPYYYNENKLNSWDASGLENEINAALKNKLKKEVILNFNTLNSNDYDYDNSKNNEVTFQLKLKMPNDISFSSKKATINIDGIQLNDAYFSSDGKVIYGNKNGNYQIAGGKKYYTPMEYAINSKDVQGEKFKFNIGLSNLSVVDGIDFWYEAECSPTVVQKYYKSLSYRTIDVSNPFPKAGNSSANVPENWRDWYCGSGTICSGNVSNQERIKNTYQNYPNNYLYKITLDSDKINKINQIDDYYTSWTGIHADGSNDFINKKGLFEKMATSSSYCPLGVIREDCD